MMIFVNHFTKKGSVPAECLKPVVQCLNPFAPHMAEELWSQLGESRELTYADWPGFDAALAKDDLITMAVQVLGKTRGTIEVEPGADQVTAEAAARAIPTVASQLEGKTIKKVIFVQGKILNFVVA
jgi:leucyl-tRNA synthetase